MCYWNCSEDNVEHLVDPGLINALSRENVDESEEELGSDKEDILVEDVADQVAIPPVVFASMHQYEFP